MNSDLVYTAVEEHCELWGAVQWWLGPVVLCALLLDVCAPVHAQVWGFELSVGLPYIYPWPFYVILKLNKWGSGDQTFEAPERGKSSPCPRLDAIVAVSWVVWVEIRKIYKRKLSKLPHLEPVEMQNCATLATKKGLCKYWKFVPDTCGWVEDFPQFRADAVLNKQRRSGWRLCSSATGDSALALTTTSVGAALRRRRRGTAAAAELVPPSQLCSTIENVVALSSFSGYSAQAQQCSALLPGLGSHNGAKTFLWYM